MEEKTKNREQPAQASFELAGFMARAASSVIDGILLALIGAILLSILAQMGERFGSQLLEFVGFALPIAYYWYFWTRRGGQTPGKFALSIRVIKADGSEIADVDALIRAIGYHVSALFFGLGFVWAIFDKNNQTWHDKLARTYVVRAENQRNTVSIGE